jgi:hypothetical protein
LGMFPETGYLFNQITAAKLYTVYRHNWRAMAASKQRIVCVPCMTGRCVTRQSEFVQVSDHDATTLARADAYMEERKEDRRRSRVLIILQRAL